MNQSNRRIVLGAAIALTAAIANISPAAAMGRSTLPAGQQSANAMSDRLTQVGLSDAQTGSSLKGQVDALRQEMQSLKARLAILQSAASRD
jgi:TolA-binding protein